MKTFKYLMAGLLLAGCFSIKAREEDSKHELRLDALKLLNDSGKTIKIETIVEKVKDVAVNGQRGKRSRIVTLESYVIPPNEYYEIKGSGWSHLVFKTEYDMEIGFVPAAGLHQSDFVMFQIKNDVNLHGHSVAANFAYLIPITKLRGG